MKIKTFLYFVVKIAVQFTVKTHVKYFVENSYSIAFSNFPFENCSTCQFSFYGFGDFYCLTKNLAHHDHVSVLDGVFVNVGLTIFHFDMLLDELVRGSVIREFDLEISGKSLLIMLAKFQIDLPCAGTRRGIPLGTLRPF